AAVARAAGHFRFRRRGERPPRGFSAMPTTDIRASIDACRRLLRAGATATPAEAGQLRKRGLAAHAALVASTREYADSGSPDAAVIADARAASTEMVDLISALAR